MSKITELPLKDIFPSETNQRKQSGLGEKQIRELRDSIKVRGVISPILVRPHKSKKDKYEIIYGERRWIASGEAGCKTIPAIVRDVSDQEAIELQVTENLQREGLHPIEEAQGYQDMLMLRAENGKPLYDIAALAQKLGKSEAYLYGRLKLLKMPKEAQEAMWSGKLNHSIALLLARIPDPKLAAKATLEILDPWKTGKPTDPEVEPMSFRKAKDHIQNNYMRRLKGSPFNQEDEHLVPVHWLIRVAPASRGSGVAPASGGSGKGEEKEITTAHSEPLDEIIPLGVTQCYIGERQDDDGQGRKKTVCTLFEGKADAASPKSKVLLGELTKKEAEELCAALNSGIISVDRLCGGKCSTCPFRTGNMKKLFPDVESADVCTNTACFKRKTEADWKKRNAIAKEEGHTLLKDGKASQLFYDGALNHQGRSEFVDLAEKPEDKKKTWEEILGDNCPKEVVRAKDDKGKTHYLVPVAAAFEAAKKAGVKVEKPKQEPRRNGYSQEDYEKEQAERQKKRERAGAIVTEASRIIGDGIKKLKVNTEFWRFLTLESVQGNEHYWAPMFKCKDEADLIKSIEKKFDDAELRVVLVATLFLQNTVYHNGELSKSFLKLCDFLGIDLKKITKEVDAALAVPEKAEKEKK